MRKRLFTVGAALSLTLAACGGQGGGDGSDAPAASVGGSAATASGGGTAEWTPEYVDGVLQPLPDGFPEDSLVFLNADEPGSTDGIYARHWAEALADISPVPIEVVDRADFPTYGSWEAMKWQEEQPGGTEGYYVQVVSVVGGALDLIATPVAQDLDVTLDDMNYVISTELVPFVLTQRKDPPWGSTSLDDMVAYAKENPGEIKYICFGAGSGRDISWAFYAETLGIEVDDSACGDGSQGIAAIIGSGEGDMALNTPDAALVGYEAGVTDVIFVTGTQPAPEPWSDVPNGADIGIEDDPYGVTRGWAVSKETPDLHRAWLHELFRAGGETDELQEARNTLPGITLFSKDHDETRAIAEAALEYTTPILQDLGLYVDPNE